MKRPPRFLPLTVSLCSIVLFAIAMIGCQDKPPKPRLSNYPIYPKRTVPPFMQGSLYELTDLENEAPFLVSGWGLVVNLEGTGGSQQVANVVKAFMAKQLEAKGFGSKLSQNYANITPEMVLHDKNAAIVEVYGWIPPGAVKDQYFDIAVRAEGREVTSLAHGMLYDTQLTINGADRLRPPSVVNVHATAGGPVFVNPALAVSYSGIADTKARQSLRTGTIIGGGRVVASRAILLRLRQPETRLSRIIESRVNDAFHLDRVCTAFDQGYCQLWVPPKFQGDWEHFTKLVTHLYLQGGSEAFARAKARELAAEARKPMAPLQDISYCWEGLGIYAMPELSTILADPTTHNDVRFAAARAAAYIGDPSGAAERALYDIALDSSSQFQLPAVQVLGRVPNSRAVNQLLRDLLDSEKTTVRIEAYNILARNHDPSIETHVLGSARDSSNQKFALDFVHSSGAPLIYATRSGIPRIALFGEVPQLTLPITFSAMDNRLMISSGAVGQNVTIFYRSSQLPNPVQMSSPPDLADVLNCLAGQVDDPSGELDFTYAEILGILQSLSDQQKLRVTRLTGQEMAAAFMMQESPVVNDAIDNAPLLDRGRPQGANGAPTIDAPAPPGGPKSVGLAPTTGPTAMKEQ
ncbi:MAG TPA: flagellar basal body P-ring protein FlgI [Tepidisphaeraceae bacterium]|nr:flagellar basal body P-ring protein FlgI [Tepidisphaeraceae bacterium]